MKKLSWENRIPIFKNPVIVKQLGLGIGTPFGILLIFLLVIKAWYGVAVVAALVVLTFFAVLLIFRGTYDVEYILDDKGVACRNQEKQRKRVKAVSAAAFILGMLTGKLTAAGAGLSSGGRTEVFIRWKHIRKVKYLDRYRVIYIKGRFLESAALFCDEENYPQVKRFVEDKLIMFS